jgi:FMN phosphatase YigB (HAD superfamily)
MLRAVLLNVGGTLWPNDLPVFEGEDPRLKRLRRVLPGVDPIRALAALRECLRADHMTQVQDTHGALAVAVRAWSAAVDVVAVRRALCVPASAGLHMFPGAADLLMRIRALGLTTVIVSNVQTRGAVEFEADFAHFGIRDLVDAVITSLDVCYRKPHRAMFDAALREAGCEASVSVMVGNSEANDIPPGHRPWHAHHSRGHRRTRPSCERRHCRSDSSGCRGGPHF